MKFFFLQPQIIIIIYFNHLSYLNMDGRLMDENGTKYKHIGFDESDKVEFKIVFPNNAQKIAKEMVAFANTKGGRIIFGVDDDGYIKGVPEKNDVNERVVGVARSCKPSLSPFFIEDRRDGLLLVIVNIEETFAVHSTTNGVHWKRVGKSCVQMDADEITFLKLQRQSLEMENKQKLLNKITDLDNHTKTDLIVSPEWSIKKITQDNYIGHITFKLKNNTGKTILIYGYQMLRINPRGEKDFYWKGKSISVNEYHGWNSDNHFKIVLWKNDEHIFHWNDTNIITTYGLNEEGIWTTEIQIAYLEEGSKNISVSIGRAEIEFK